MSTLRGGWCTRSDATPIWGKSSSFFLAAVHPERAFGKTTTFSHTALLRSNTRSQAAQDGETAEIRRRAGSVVVLFGTLKKGDVLQCGVGSRSCYSARGSYIRDAYTGCLVLSLCGW